MKRSSSNQLTLKCLRLALAAGTALMAFSTISYAQMPPAQNAHPITRAQVRAELEELESVGYMPGASDPHYPDDILAAESKVAQKHLAQGNAAAPAAEFEQRAPLN